jgi:hypothetical protein
MPTPGPTFGQHEIVRELHRSGLTRLWLARAPGNGETLVVKELEAAPEILGAHAAGAAVAAFIQRAKVQKQAADVAGSAWAPVLDFGETERGAYLVSRHYARSAQRLITQKAKIDGGVLLRIALSVVAGLRQIREACGRGHGELAPQNVLIVASAEEPVAGAVLNDPAAAMPGDTQGGLAADLRGLGELIYQLVMHQPFRARAGWPLPDSPEWGRLGAGSAGWRELCSTLLDPSLGDSPPALEQIEESLAKLRPIERKRGKLLAIGAAAVVLLAGGGVVAMLAMREKEEAIVELADYDAEAWIALCTEQYQWLDGLLRSIDGRTSSGAAARAKLAADPYLRETLRLIEDYGARLTAQAIAKSDKPADVLGKFDNHPPAAKTAAAMRLTQEALERIEAIKGRLSPAELAQEGGWGDFRRVSECMAQCTQRSWSGPAEFLRTVTGAITPSHNAVELLSGVVEVLPLVSRLEKLAADVDRIGNVNDPILGQFGEVVAQALHGGGDRRQVEQALRNPEDLAERLAGFLDTQWKRVDRSLLVTRSVYESVGAEPPSATRFNMWLTEAQDEKNHIPGGPDPRSEAWLETLAAIEQDIDQLTGEFQVRPEDGPAEYLAEAARLRGQIAELAKLDWNRANQAEVTRGAQSVETSLESLRPAVKSAVVRRIDLRNQSISTFRENLKQENQIVASDSPALDEAWRRGRDAILQEESKIESLDASSMRLREFLTDIDRRVPRHQAQATRPWESELQRFDQRRRNEALAAVLEGVTWDRGVPTGDAPLDGAVQALEEWRKNFAALIADAAQLEDRLDEMWDAQARSAPGEPTIAELAASCRGHDLYQDPEIAAALEPVLSRFTNLERVLAETSREQLLADARDTRAPAAAMAAWRRLEDESIPWPAVEASLAQESNLQGILLGAARRVDSTDRREQLEAELRQGARRRWARHMGMVSAAEEFRLAIAMREALGGDTEMLDARGKFNMLVHQLEAAQADSALDEESLTGAIQTFMAQARSLALEDVRVSELLGALTGLTSDAPPPKVDIATLGPGAVGWTAEVATDGQGVRFTKGAMSVDFVRVEPSGGSPAFIATTEVSFQLFQGVLNDSGQMAAALDILANYGGAVVDPRRGPRVWRRPTRTRIATDIAWLAGTPQVWPRSGQGPGRIDPYPPDINAGAPEPGAPMQWIPPSAAVMMARGMNCRLPTGEEWMAALAIELQGRTLEDYVQESRPNLRDTTWARQLAYMNSQPDSQVGAAIDPAAGSVYGQADRRSENYDDGVLWFAPIDQGAGTRFKHLIGNVAELAFSDPLALDALPAGVPAAEAEVALRNGQLTVAGYSALGPRDPDPLHPIPTAAGLGNSDVGFRLAFSAEGAGILPQPLTVRLGEVLATARYLAASGG